MKWIIGGYCNEGTSNDRFHCRSFRWSIPKKEPELGETWKFLIDNEKKWCSSWDNLNNPRRAQVKLYTQVRIQSNKHSAEYKALLVGLQLAKEMHNERVKIKCVSQLVVNQVNRQFSAKDKIMDTYLIEVMSLLQYIDKFTFRDKKMGMLMLCLNWQVQ